MANDRLRASMTSAGMTIATLSEYVGVDPKTVERWIAKERIPHRTHRMSVAAALGQDDGYLWPSILEQGRTPAISRAELVTIHQNRRTVPLDTWLSLTRNARESIDILAYAASFLHDALPDFVDILAEKAAAGVGIRLLLGDPESDGVRLRGREEGIDDMLAARCRLTWRYFASIITTDGVIARKHGSTLYNSIFRFDDAMLTNTHIYGAPASHSPTLHIQRLPEGRLFKNYMLGFERVWSTGEPVTDL
ncbi:XRE family transcriptional regulator [Phytoactinopolyspora mesophila]|uniref:XRE family transcriptional regulator n=1 Tax=Phytoactinopolyspora mesophila TaxID=2650750 RepID=A0A7K3MA68_9ACTN|nr:XRE family transcriptional regulator [Phytoactinopolyspora mesophila]NDL60183.1 XRE family transcriptional regulator [Phytoactinopolyspora mesophila]